LARKILLADDSVTAQNMGRKILTDAGYEVVTVNNGSAALKKVAEHKPDLIVLDVYMPGYSGLEVCQRIKENKETARIPILLTVGKLEPFKPEEARKARADAFVVKPFEASELLTALTKLEEKVVPQAEPYKQGRFARAMATVDSEESGEKFGDSDGGWKARLRFPSASRKSRDSEPDIDYASTQGKGVRDADIAESSKKQNSKSAEPQFERPIPTGLPHDITPEEIAAITAAAAQLSGAQQPQPPAAEASSAASLAEVPSPEPPGEEPVPVTFASSPSLQEPEIPVQSEPAGVGTPSEAPATASSVQSAPTGDAASIDAPVPTTETKSEETFPVEQAAYDEPQITPEPSETMQPPVVEPVMESAVPEAVAEAATPVPAENADLQIPEAKPEPDSSTATAADDELMTALQSLMPVVDNAAPPASGEKVEDLPPALAAIVAEVDSRILAAHSAGPRWIAEEVALAASEATLSLQKEMEQAYAAYAAADGFHAAASSMQGTGSAMAVADAVPAAPFAEEVSAAVIETPAVLAMAAAAAETGIAVTAVQSPTEEVPVANEPVHPPQHEESHESVKSVEYALEASAQEMSEAVVDDAAAPLTSSDTASASTETEDVGGTEDMAANWKNIRDSIAGGAAKPALAKEETREVESGQPEAKAASGPPASGAADPKAIANIVDSVLAELRPKIVEEIAKKLADPKKS
jgi:CheY-like chemotaxis protein